MSQSPWPVVDRSLIVSTHVTYVAQVNGKKRGELTIERDADAKDDRNGGARPRRRHPGDG